MSCAEPSYTRVQGVFYPVVCFTSPGAVGVCNFGEKPFKYDLGVRHDHAHTTRHDTHDTHTTHTRHTRHA